MKPPELVSRARMFSGPVFDVERDRVRFEDGREVTLDIVRHRASVVLIPMPSAGEVILVRQYRHAIARWIWELPAGTSDPGEDPVTAAARECHEEIGMAPGRLTNIGTLFPTPGFCDEAMTFYLAEDLREPGHAAEQDEDEQLEPGTFTLSALEAKAGRGELEDMKTVCGLELLRRFRERRD
ncbi:MAG TPA: NUDIX hydrolase [Vicinamibacterales bacterium]|nr:NUDIX hydrolase [Vicinamibacterales bacterium]